MFQNGGLPKIWKSHTHELTSYQSEPESVSHPFTGNQDGSDKNVHLEASKWDFRNQQVTSHLQFTRGSQEESLHKRRANTLSVNVLKH